MKRGFTLIELLVSVAIFTVVMVVALGALLSISESDRKAQTLKTVTNNLSFALEGVSRMIRTGTEYSCGSAGGGDCTTGGTSFYFRTFSGANWAYRWHDSSCTNGMGCIQRSQDGGSSGSWEDITAKEVIVLNCGTAFGGSTGTCSPTPTPGLLFYLTGSSLTDTFQPKVVMTVRGYVEVSASTRSGFDLQTTITQRLYDQ